MSDADDFSILLIEESKRFLEKSKAASNGVESVAYLHASLFTGFAALESHLNAISSDFEGRKEIGLLEQSVLFERDIELSAGRFELSTRLKMWRLEDRLQVLYRWFVKQEIDKSAAWWQRLKDGMGIRNSLCHPREAREITSVQIESTLEAILTVIDLMYKAVYKRPYPSASRGLVSELDF
jgi:hypothetical protein